MPTHKQCEFCDLTQRCQKLDCYCRNPEVMSEICLCCQSQDVKEDEETTEDPIKKMRTEIDLRRRAEISFLLEKRVPHLSALSNPASKLPPPYRI